MEIKKNDTVDTIKAFLLNNGYKPGDRIPTQSELSETLGISARHLRDGINVLVNQGFLIPRGRAGTFMTNPQMESVVEPIRWFYEIKDVPSYDLILARVVLERAIICEACANRTTKDLLLLQQIVDSQTERPLPADRELQLDKDFHLQLVGSAHNKALDIVGNVILVQLDLLYTKNLYPKDDPLRSTDHQDIIDALFQRDEKRAVDLIKTHIERCYVLANSALENPLADQ